MIRVHLVQVLTPLIKAIITYSSSSARKCAHLPKQWYSIEINKTPESPNNYTFYTRSGEPSSNHGPFPFAYILQESYIIIEHMNHINLSNALDGSVSIWQGIWCHMVVMVLLAACFPGLSQFWKELIIAILGLFIDWEKCDHYEFPEFWWEEEALT